MTSKNLKYLFLFSIALFFAFLISLGVGIEPDTGTYIDKSVLRSPLYPLLIQTSEVLFGKGVYLPVIIVQLSLLFLSSFQLTRTLEKHFKLPAWLFGLVLWTLVGPYAIKWGHFLLSQGLAYPLFLLSVNALLKTIFEKPLEQKFEAKQLATFFAFTTLLILTRRQFMFMLVVGGCLILYKVIFALAGKNLNFKKIFCALLLIPISYGTANIVERSYHYHYNGVFTTVPFVGVQLAVAPFYLAKAGDVSLFSDPTQKQIFEKVKQILQKNCTDAECEFKDLVPPYPHYYMNYNNISWGALWPGATDVIRNTADMLNSVENKALGTKITISVDKNLIDMSFILIKAHFGKWLKLYISNIINNIGGYFFAMILGFCFLGSFYLAFKAVLEQWRQSKNENETQNKHKTNEIQKEFAYKLSIGLWFIILMNFGNYSLVALVEPAMTVYNFYTNTILTVFLLIVLWFTGRKLSSNYTHERMANTYE